jgi:DNA polymerase III subunit beta
MMKFTVKKSDILDVLSRVQGLTGRRSNLAITTNVLIRSSADGIQIAATDLETGFEGAYGADIESGGNIALNARKLFEIVRDFPDEDIHIHEKENRWIRIGNDHVEYHLLGMNPEDFPEIPKIEGVSFLEIGAYDFKKMIEKSLMIGVSDDKRAHITGVFFEKIEMEKGHLVRMVSTDGSRLSKVDYGFEADFDLPADSVLIIPKKGLHEVTKFLDAEGTVAIGFKDNHFITKRERETIIIRLLEGDFPKYADVIEKGDAHIVNLDKKSFLMMLKRMSILSSENYKGVIFSYAPDRLVITSTNPDIGESKEEMAISYDGESMEVAFNPRYFIETINVIDGDKILIYLMDSEKPCLIEGDDEDSFVSVVMPMRI